MKANKTKNTIFLPLLVGGLLTTSLLGIKNSINIDKEPQHEWHNKISNGSGTNTSYDIYSAKYDGFSSSRVNLSVYVRGSKWELGRLEVRTRYYENETLSKPGWSDFDSRKSDRGIQYVSLGYDYNKTIPFSHSNWTPTDDKRYSNWVNVQVNLEKGGSRNASYMDPLFSFKTPNRDYNDNFILDTSTISNIGETTADVSIRLDPADEADYIDQMKISFVDEANDYVSEVVATPRDDGAGDGTVIVEATLDGLNPETTYNISAISNTNTIADEAFTFTTNPWVEKIITLNGNRGILRFDTDSVTIGYNVYSLWPNYSGEKIYLELRTHTDSIYGSWVYDSSDSTQIEEKELTKLAPNITYSGWTLNVYSYKTGTFLESHTLGDFKLAQE